MRENFDDDNYSISSNSSYNKSPYMNNEREYKRNYNSHFSNYENNMNNISNLANNTTNFESNNISFTKIPKRNIISNYNIQKNNNQYNSPSIHYNLI